MSKHRLVFKMDLPTESVSGFLEGTLTLLNPDGSIANVYRASSSAVGKQFMGAWRIRKHVIPPNEPYTVALIPSQSNLDGIRGDFYAISPYSIKTIGDTRAAFGIHNDPNRDYALGSLGCIVFITNEGFNAFKRDIKALREQHGYSSIPLAVEYSAI